MTKVCHMTSAHAPGDVRIFQKECVSLAQAGYHVYLVQRGDSGESQGVHIVGVGYPSGGRIARMTSFARKVYEAAYSVDADIYHLHDPELLPYGLKLIKKGKKVIFDSHEFTAEAIFEKTWLPMFLRSLIFRCYSRYEASVCKKMTAIVTVSPNIVQYFSKFNPNTVMVTNYPIMLEMFTPPTFTKKSIFFGGGITDTWMHGEILKALEQTPDCRYVLCGSGDASYLESLRAMPGWKQVDYMGRISHDMVLKKMQDSFIGVALARPGRNSDWHNGTMGNTKIYEEMMAGLPVICTDFVRWKEFVDRYYCGICVDPTNTDEIASAIRYLLDHPEEAKQMGQNSRRAVEEEFNWSVEEKKLLSLYASI